MSMISALKRRPRAATLWRYARLPVLALLVYMVFFRRGRLLSNLGGSYLQPSPASKAGDALPLDIVWALERGRAKHSELLEKGRLSNRQKKLDDDADSKPGTYDILACSIITILSVLLCIACAD